MSELVQSVIEASNSPKMVVWDSAGHATAQSVTIAANERNVLVTNPGSGKALTLVLPHPQEVAGCIFSIAAHTSASAGTIAVTDANGVSVTTTNLNTGGEYVVLYSNGVSYQTLQLVAS